jgi:hypothetical protein
MISNKAMFLWSFEDAPEELRSLSEHGGDEDGLLFLPEGLELPWWVERLWNQYGDPQVVEFKGPVFDEATSVSAYLRGTVYIWAHA